MIRILVTIVASIAGLLVCTAIVFATPKEEVSPKHCESGDDKVLLVFNGGASTVTVNSSDPKGVIVTIADADSQTVVFGDRPSRSVGVVDTQVVIDFLADVASSDPANLAIVGRLKGGGKETLVIEALWASVQPNAGEIVLEGRVLEVLDTTTDTTSDKEFLGRMPEDRSYESIDVFVDDVSSCCPGDAECDVTDSSSCWF